MKKVCIVTGTRAEWGLMSRLAGMIKADRDTELQIVAANMHLSERFGLTYKEIEADGFVIDYRVPMDVDGDDAMATVRSMAMGIEGFGKAYQALAPDLIIILGDRYEMLMAASAALIFNIPVAHLYGGDITQGAYDDAIRHSITKLSHIHFTSTEDSRMRVIQMGEHPSSVHYVGSLGVDNIKNIALMSKEELERSLDGFGVDKNTILVTYHPVTLEGGAEVQIGEILAALDALPSVRVIFTMPNSDTGGNIIASKIKAWCGSNSNRAIWFTSLGLKRYLSTLQYIGAVVGNSSSGIGEVPSFGIPTLNIGNRQQGRIAAHSVINCRCVASEIRANVLEILQILTKNRSFVVNPYEKADTASEILKIVKDTDLTNIITKQFYNNGTK